MCQNKATAQKLWKLLIATFVILLAIRLLRDVSRTYTNAFTCAINCIDGRIQPAVRKYMRDYSSAKYVDMITEAGPNKILAQNSDHAIIENIKKRLEISKHRHDAKIVAIVGHHGCAANPGNKEEQIAHLRETKKVVEGFNLDMEIILLWVDGDFKTVHKVE